MIITSQAGRSILYARRKFLVLLVGACTTLALLSTRQLWLPGLYTFLDISQPPRSADTVVILGGGGLGRPQLGVTLFHEEYARHVIVSGLSGMMDYAIQALTDGGIPSSAIIVNDKATSTFNEAQQVLESLQHMNADSALIVTDRFHTRRAAATYYHLFRDSGIELTFVSPEDTLAESDWWQSSRSSYVWSEYIKMLYYWIVYGIWSG